MKQMELQLQQVLATVMDMQARVGSMEDFLGLVVDRKLEEVMD